MRVRDTTQLTDHLPTRTEGEGETLDMPEGMGTFTSGPGAGRALPDPRDARAGWDG